MALGDGAAYIAQTLLPALGGNPPPYEFGFQNALSGEALVDILRRARTVRAAALAAPPPPPLARSPARHLAPRAHHPPPHPSPPPPPASPAPPPFL
jgi:hypothetical protein